MTTATRTTTITGTTSSHAGSLRLRAELRGGRTVIAVNDGHVPYAARVVPGRQGWARVVLVQTIAGPLGGDRVTIDVEVGRGAALELAANAATLAFPASATARQQVRIGVAENARVAWLPQALILGAGCDLEASLDVALAEGAAVVTRELVVLGRHGEEPGRYRSRFRCELDSRPLLHDEIRVDGPTTPVDLDGARAYGSLALLGLHAPPADREELVLAGPGRVMRALGSDAATVHARLAATEAAWLEEIGARAGGLATTLRHEARPTALAIGRGQSA